MSHVVARLRVSRIIPYIYIARFNGNGGVHAVIDGQVEEHRGVAAVDIGERLGVNTCAGVGYAVPSVAVARGSIEIGGVGVVDGEMEGDHRVATVDGLKVLGVNAGRVVGDIVPDVEVAGGVVDGVVRVVVDDELEGDDGVAAVGVDGVDGVVVDGHRSVERCLVDETMVVVGGSSADSVFEVHGIDGIHRQGQGDDTVGAEDVGGPDGVVIDGRNGAVRCLVGKPMVIVSVSSTDSFVKMYGINRIHCQGQGGDGVAAVGVGSPDGVVMDDFLGGVRGIVGESMRVVDASCGDGLLKVHGINRVDRQRQGHDTVASVGVVSVDGVVIG